MMRRLSLQWRLVLSLGMLLALLWLAAAVVTTVRVDRQVDQVLDAALQETAQRILPLAVSDILAREQEGLTQRLAQTREHDEFLTYAVRDAQGRILLLSHEADPAVFPPWSGPGFGQSATHRFYHEDTLQGSVRLTLAEPLARRAAVTRDLQMGLGLPLLVVLPLALLAIVLAVRASLRPLYRLRAQLALRGVRDLSPVPVADLPDEVAPVAETVNGLLGRLSSAFEAERSFAANAAHELRTPLAGAIAQAQRLQAETHDPAAQRRAADIQGTLKRLTRLSERLMQLARAEGGRLRLDHATDLRPIARLITDDLARLHGRDRLQLTLPDTPLMSDLDPDVWAIVLRNLIENALRHGAEDRPVEVTLSAQGWLKVANDGPLVPSEVLARLTQRFERASAHTAGSGLGLAIVQAIAERTGAELVLASPRPGQDSGFEAKVGLRVEG